MDEKDEGDEEDEHYTHPPHPVHPPHPKLKNMNKKNNFHFGILVVMIIAAALSRLLPHPPNFTPIGGMALFGAAYFTKKYWALIIPILALWFSSLLLDNIVYAQYYDGFVWFSNPMVYIAFVAIVAFGWLSLKKIKPANLLGASLGASLIFFIISNLGSWVSYGMYPMNLAGLLECYIAAIPFFPSTLAGDLFFTAVLFGGYELIKNRGFITKREMV